MASEFSYVLQLVDAIVDSYGETAYLAGIKGGSEEDGVQFYIETLDEVLDDFDQAECKVLIAVMARRLWLARRYMAPSTHS